MSYLFFREDHLQEPHHLAPLPKQASAGPSIARTPQAPTNSVSPKYMPPCPKTTPTLPDWLVNRKVSPAAPSGNSNLTSSGSYPGSVPRRTFPNTPSFGIGTQAVQSHQKITMVRLSWVDQILLSTLLPRTQLFQINLRL